MAGIIYDDFRSVNTKVFVDSVAVRGARCRVRVPRAAESPLAEGEIRYRNRVTLTEFQSTLKDASPPYVPPPAAGAVAGRQGRLGSGAPDRAGCRRCGWGVAYLHRKEGDVSNARYWYRQAGQQPATDTLESEWVRIVVDLLSRP
jgi:hypothetical protein